MSIFGMMRTSVSGLSAQASKLSTVGDNIANASTVGYKKASIEFSSLVLHDHGGKYSPGGVESDIRYGISQQGALSFTSSQTDLAVSGEGFFVVTDGQGQSQLTRSGAFILNGDSELINASGYKLMGYSAANGTAQAAINGTAGLESVSLNGLALTAQSSTAGTLSANFPADGAIVAAADLPSANAATAAPTAKTSIVVYDNLGREIVLDIYASKTAAETWEVTVFNRADAAVGAIGSFPYTAAALATQTYAFDAATGELTGASATSISIPLPNGGPLVLDMSQSSQLATDFEVGEIEINGNGPAGVSGIDLDDDGMLYAIYENGARVATYRIPLANVASPDMLKPTSGTLYGLSAESGDLQIGFPGESGFGTIVTGALEQSTVDIADELTAMIEAQRSYTANSKVFQTASEILDVLNSLKR